MALSSPSDGNLQDNAMLVLVFLSRKAIKLPIVFAVAIWRGCRLRTLIVVWEAPYLRCGLIHSIIVFHVNFHLEHMIEFLKTSSCKHEHLRHIHYRQKITVRERSALYYLCGLFSSHCSKEFLWTCCSSPIIRKFRNEFTLNNGIYPVCIPNNYVLFTYRRRSLISICVYLSSLSHM